MIRFVWRVSAAAAAVAEELIEGESTVTQETRQRVTTTQTKRRQWTEYEGFLPFYCHQLYPPTCEDHFCHS